MTHNSARPTQYRGINFRSRLEARWAAFFDILGWPWEYEPECEGNYIPDFLIHGTSDRRAYVEIKPFATYLGDKAAIIAKAHDAIGFGELLLVLTDQFPQAIGFPNVAIFGFMHTNDDDGDDDHAILFQPGGKKHGLEYDFAGEFGSWHGRLTGAYDGNALFESSMISKAELLQLWSRAGNAIQWKPGQPAR